MPTRNRATARATGEPYTLKSSPATLSVWRPRGPSRRRCVSTGSAAVNQPLVPDLDSDLLPANGQRKRSKGSAGGTVPSNTHLTEDSIISISEEPPADRRMPTSTQSAPVVPLARHRESTDETATSRPKQRPKSNSNPLPNTELTSLKLDNKIRAWLKKPLPGNQYKSERVGNNYFFEAIVAEGDGKKVMKIGATKGYEPCRLGTIGKECQHFQIEEQDDPEHMPIRLYQRAEKLMHAELSNFQYSFNCRCKTGSGHREYFEVSKTAALEVVQRWREFCKREPYDQRGRLKPFWEERLKYLASYGEPGTDHRRRGERWRRFMNPGFLTILTYDIKEYFTTLWKLRWQIIAFVESFVIVLLTFPNLYNMLFFAFVSAWIMIEMVNLEQPVTWGLFGWKTDGFGTTPLSRALTAEFESVPRCQNPPSILDQDGSELFSVGGEEEVENSLLENESLYDEEEESPEISLLDDAVSEVSEQTDVSIQACDEGI
jgi:hypothetical protein